MNFTQLLAHKEVIKKIFYVYNKLEISFYNKYKKRANNKIAIQNLRPSSTKRRGN